MREPDGKLRQRKGEGREPATGRIGCGLSHTDDDVRVYICALIYIDFFSHLIRINVEPLLKPIYK
jgi:hypothetical protein